jgi:AcrR family transcriptional regulator
MTRIVYSRSPRRPTRPKPKRKSAVSPRKQPTQERARETRDVLLQAAAHIVATEGVAAFNTNRVARAAGVSVGSLYQYYPNKDALLVALSEQHHAHIVVTLRAMVSATAGWSLERTVACVVHGALAQQFDNVALSTALEHAEQRLPETEVLRALHCDIERLSEQLLAPYTQAIRAEPACAARDVLTIIQALVNEASLRGEKSTPGLHSRIERAALGYLLYQV